MDTIQEKIIRIVREIVKADSLPDAELLNKNYLDGGLFDSFQLIEIITKIENEFGIKFLMNDLTSQKFQTLQGISELIKEGINKK